jgi:2-dehydropantoate 2-reductase
MEHALKSVTVWGAGAMGGCVGASLVRAGHEVTFVDQDEDHVVAMNVSGLRITGPVESFAVPARALLPEEVEGPLGLVFLCVKSHHTRDALEVLAPLLDPTGAVVSVQNGLCEHWIAERVGDGRTVGAFMNFGADVLEPGLIHRGNRGATVVGELDGRLTPRIREIHGLFRLFEPEAVLTDNIFGYLWGKLAYASLLFATALTDDPIADVLDDRSLRPALIALAREAMTVARAHGIRPEPFDGFDPEAFRPGGSVSAATASLDDLVRFNRASAKTHSGIWRDIAVRKRKTEVDAQLGWIVELGERYAVPTPLTRALIAGIHEIEAGLRALDRRNVAELLSD